MVTNRVVSKTKQIKQLIKTVGIKPLKAKHDVTKSDLIVLLLFFVCIDINLNIQPLYLTLYMTWVHYELYRRYKLRILCK